jgi:Mor family transcriptional regulator
MKTGLAGESRLGIKRHALLTELTDLLECVLVDHEIPAIVATVVANTVIDHIVDHWGGQVIAIPKDYLWRLAQLELQIYGQFTGSNYDDLAIRYKFTERGMRKLIARVKAKLARQRGTNQLDLLADGGAQQAD